MAITATQNTVLTTDLDGDTLVDPLDTVTTTVVISNSAGPDALNVALNETLDGMTLVPGSINVSALAYDDAYNAVGNVDFVVGAADGVLNGATAVHTTIAADAEFLGATVGTNGATQTVIQNPGVAVATSQGGSVTIAADGSFTYTPALDFNGTDTFTYTLVDQGGLTSTGTVSIAVGPSVWFIDNTAAPGGNGTQASPFNSIAAFNAANDGAAGHPAAGDTIYLRTGTGTYAETDGANLLNGQHFIGQGQALTVTPTGGGPAITIETAGTAPVIQVTGAGNEGVTLAQNNTLSGFDISTTAGSQIAIEDGGGTVGTLNVSDVSISGTGQAVDIDQGGTLAVTIDSLGSTGSSAQGVDLQGVSGSFTATAGAISGATGTAFNVVGGTLSTTYGGNITQGNNAALVNVSGGHATGTVAFNGTLGATNGTGLQFDNADGTYQFNNTTTLGGGDAGIDILNGSGGTFNFGTGASITNPSGTAFNLSASNANVTYSGSITDNTGKAVVIDNHDAGTVTFQTGSITSTGTGLTVSNSNGGAVNFNGQTTLSTGANTAVDLGTSNAGGTVNFASTGSGLDISTTSGTGFLATGGGTVSVTGAGNTISSTTGTALNIANTTIGASDVTFQSISSNGGSATGIILDTTGSSGGLHVTGTGAANSGGTIANKTGADLSRTTGVGIYLNSTSDVQLNDMQLNDFQNFAIRGFSVTGFTLDSSVINGTNGTAFGNINGTDEAGEGSIFFGNRGVSNVDGLSGTASITNSTISGGSSRNVSVSDTSNTGGELHLTIDKTTFGLTQPGSGNQSLIVEAANSSTHTHATVTDSTFNGAASDLINFTGQTGTIMDVIVGDGDDANAVGNTFANTHAANIGGGGMTLATQGVMRFDVSDNTFSGADGSAVTIFKASAGTSMEGTFDNNTIGTAGVASSGSDTGNGIFLSAAGAGTITLAITNNIIQNYDGNFGIMADNTGGSYAVNLTLTGNIVRQPGASAAGALGLTNGSPGSGDTTNVFARILNNDFGGGAPAGPDVYLGASGSNSASHTFTLSGATAADVASEAAIEAFIKNNNNLNGASATTDVDAYVDAPVAFSAFKASASLPPVPTAPTPLLAAPGGVELGTDGSERSDLGLSPNPTPSPQDDPSDPASPPVVVDDGLLSQAELALTVAAALERWADAGLSAAQLAALDGMTFAVADMSGWYLGSFAPGAITLDADAAGQGWFVDATPLDDSEFGNALAVTRLQTTPSGAPAGHFDLLTTLMHEMGHALGLGDTYALSDRDSLMYGFLVVGERRLPGEGQADGAVAGSITSEEFLGAPVTIGTLPGGKSVTVQWRATIDAQTNQLIDNPVNTGTINTSNLGVATTNTVTTTLDSLSLGNLIFNDLNNNGLFDSGTESGINGVTLTLFADNGTTAGSFDLSDTQIATTTTAGGGLYAFTGVSGLAPGDYILRIDQANFSGGGALQNLRASGLGSPDPDNNVDSDDNGQALAGQGHVTFAITLAYNNEPTAGLGNDGNQTLDIGVLSSAPAAADDVASVLEYATVTGNVITDAPGQDTDPDSAFTVTAISGGTVGVAFAGAKGTLTIQANGGYSYVANLAQPLVVGATVQDTFTYTVSDGVDSDTATLTVTITGSATGDGNANTLYGSNAGDTLDGQGGNDRLYGFGGSDTTIGGLGDDWHFVDDAGDIVTDGTGQGTGDRVFASTDYTLPAGAEIEVFSTNDHAGTSPINLTGNELDNLIYGNAGSNTLTGLGGNDTLVGLGGIDTLDGGTGNDTLVGGDAADILLGGDNDDRLYGQGGNDQMTGGAGNDWYFVDDAGDVVTEAAGQGALDRVFASVGYVLTAGAEIEAFSTNDHTGTGAINLTGNELANAIYGNAGSNVINGREGNDTLYGFGGSDFFLFDTALNAATNLDAIIDFAPANDTIRLDDAIFTALAPGALPANAFGQGATVTDPNQRILHDSSTGAIYYDADGVAGGSIQFATVSAGLALTAANFFVV